MNTQKLIVIGFLIFLPSNTYADLISAGQSLESAANHISAFASELSHDNLRIQTKTSTAGLWHYGGSFGTGNWTTSLADTSGQFAAAGQALQNHDMFAAGVALENASDLLFVVSGQMTHDNFRIQSKTGTAGLRNYGGSSFATSNYSPVLTMTRNNLDLAAIELQNGRAREAGLALALASNSLWQFAGEVSHDNLRIQSVTSTAGLRNYGGSSFGTGNNSPVLFNWYNDMNSAATQLQSIPEPSTGLLMLSFIGFAFRRKRSRKLKS